MTPEQLSLLSEQDRELWELCERFPSFPDITLAMDYIAELRIASRRLLGKKVELEERVAKIAEVVASMPTVTGLQEACVKDHSIIWMAIRDAQDTFKDTVKREQKQRQLAESRIAELEERITASDCDLHRQYEFNTELESRIASLEEQKARLETALREICDFIAQIPKYQTTECEDRVAELTQTALASLSPADREKTP